MSAVALVGIGTLTVSVLDWRAKQQEAADRPPPPPRLRPVTGLMGRAGIGGIVIGQPIDQALRAAGQPHYPHRDLQEAVAYFKGPHDLDSYARFSNGLISYTPSTRRVSEVGLHLSARLHTRFGDTLGSPLGTVLRHYPDAVRLDGRCHVNPDGTDLLMRASAPGYLLVFSFGRQGLAAVDLTTWSRWTFLCRLKGGVLGAIPPNPIVLAATSARSLIDTTAIRTPRR